MAAVSALVPDIRASIPDIPSFVAERQILRAARVFCEETRSWRINFQISVVGSVTTVSLVASLPSGTELVDVISIKNVNGGAPVSPVTYAWLDKNATNWRSESDLNAKYYVLNSNNVLRLVPKPSTTTAFLYDARVAVKPLRTATTLNDVLMNKYDEVLIDGALAYLYLMPRKPWTDGALAAVHSARFQASFAGARAAAADEFQVGVARKVRYGGL